MRWSGLDAFPLAYHIADKLNAQPKLTQFTPLRFTHILQANLLASSEERMRMESPSASPLLVPSSPRTADDRAECAPLTDKPTHQQMPFVQ